jgi:methylated-DNA-[protein]-cysteine S-methyltransferase
MTAVTSLQFTALFDSPLGPLALHHDGKSINSLDYLESPALPVTQPLRPAWHLALMDYFAGEFDRLNDLPIHLLKGTAFQQDVWLALREIPVGQTISYKTMAQLIGRPRAIRAVGQALRHNPLPIILPCHRVIRQSGDLGGYAGASDIGIARKRFLLWHEGSYPLT